MIGKVYRTKNGRYDFIPLVKDKNGFLIDSKGSQISIPFVVFCTNEKVYYLSVTIFLASYWHSDFLKNYYTDEFNLFIPQGGISNVNDHSVINCESINIMDRALFEKIYDVKHYKNNHYLDWQYKNKYYLDKEIYYQVIDKLNNNLDNLVYHEIDHIDFEFKRSVWKPRNTYNKNHINTYENHKEIIEFVINCANYLISSSEVKETYFTDYQFYNFIEEGIELQLNQSNLEKPVINHDSIYYSIKEHED
ncbi:hypothetical protein DIE66_00515 [Mycoplasmopsis arginini]|uniref:Mbov_0400 family ICE element protein n=1 Tax=Mycoplasmopsis arginini TaxID=2094 RepID=UPI000D61969B|nr:hypothetical protein [Mycoplasmopsis arginini]PWC09107.1 hypothetical protein DIE66_00515 [Mycoplasmopsis arginini]